MANGERNGTSVGRIHKEPGTDENSTGLLALIKPPDTKTYHHRETSRSEVQKEKCLP
jgi:hypothetical protein